MSKRFAAVLTMLVLGVTLAGTIAATAPGGGSHAPLADTGWGKETAPYGPIPVTVTP
ncbi:hypothetical protein [Longispora albida]|uniref:hypothetical protein n=1 Tax=Longispora albida TaxID=203523 RepID=UPI0003A5127C|nr:hypothetical protein [Longispora albida]